MLGLRWLNPLGRDHPQFAATELRIYFRASED
jgi:hypothetical protein